MCSERERRARLLNWPRLHGQPLNVIIATFIVDCFAPQQPIDDLNHFTKATHPFTWSPKRSAHGCMVTREHTCPNAQLSTSIRDVINSESLFG